MGNYDRMVWADEGTRYAKWWPPVTLDDLPTHIADQSDPDNWRITFLLTGPMFFARWASIKVTRRGNKTYDVNLVCRYDPVTKAPIALSRDGDTTGSWVRTSSSTLYLSDLVDTLCISSEDIETLCNLKEEEYAWLVPQQAVSYVDCSIELGRFYIERAHLMRVITRMKTKIMQLGDA